MALSLNKPKLDNLASDIWKSAERLRGKFKSYEYQSVILPIIVIRRLECVPIAWREKKAAEVLVNRPKLTDKERAKLVKGLELNPNQCPFSNKTDWTLRKVYEEDPTLLENNFRDYINGFSKNVDDIIEHFNYRNTISLMVKNNRLAPILNQYKELALGPDQLSGLEMGYIYEELLRRFSEQSGDEAGEHFTPREVIRLMVGLLDIPIPDQHLSIYDPASGTGGMLSVAKEHLLERADTPEERARVEKYVTVHGQELSPTNYAVCQADLLIKEDRQATVHLGNSLIPHDPHGKEPGDQWPEPKYHFNRMLSNPPFGVTWGGKDGYETEARKLEQTRYRAGMPRVNDGFALPANDAGEDGPAREGRQPHRHHLQRLASLQRRLRLRRERNPPLDPRRRLARRHRYAAGSAFLQHRHLHLRLAAAQRQAGRPLRPGHADRRPPAVREGTQILRQQTQPHHRRPPRVQRRENAQGSHERAEETLSVEWTHRHYVQDDEYIPHGEEIEAFLKREIAKPIIRWTDSPQLGYEILPNKYFYRYQPPTPAKNLLAEFWRLEKEAEKLLEGLAQ